MYKVYKVSSQMYYEGYSLVAAHSAEEANGIIADWKTFDNKNVYDSYGYSFVDEEDVIDNLYANCGGFILHGIYYSPR